MTDRRAATMDTLTASTTDERADLLDTLAKHRHFLRLPTAGLTDAQARARSTVSELCLGGLIKHVTATEQLWARFIVDGPSVFGSFGEFTAADWEQRAREFQLLESESLAEVLDTYDEVAARTDQLVTALPDLNAAHPLPAAPWFETGAHWSARRVLLHIIAETAQHAGHADILRESIDGAKSMG